MNNPQTPETRLPELLRSHAQSVLEEWLRQQALENSRTGRSANADAAEQSRTLLDALSAALRTSGRSDDISTPEWTAVRDILSDLSQARAKAGFSPSETAQFVFSLKQAIFALLRRELGSQPEALASETWATSLMIDNLGLLTMDAYLRAREQTIIRQQQELLELSTPVVKLWDGIVAVPLIGTLDSERTQIVMESLLQQVVDTGASIAIIDITGVPTVDTLVAQHLLKTVAAARLMGAECIISGIRPQIAATIVHLGVDLGNVITKATLADAFRLALHRFGLMVKNTAAKSAAAQDTHGTDSNS